MKTKIISTKHLFALGAITVLIPPVGAVLLIRELKYFEKKAVNLTLDKAQLEVINEDLKERENQLTKMLEHEIETNAKDKKKLEKENNQLKVLLGKKTKENESKK